MSVVYAPNTSFSAKLPSDETPTHAFPLAVGANSTSVPSSVTAPASSGSTAKAFELAFFAGATRAAAGESGIRTSSTKYWAPSFLPVPALAAASTYQTNAYRTASDRLQFCTVSVVSVFAGTAVDARSHRPTAFAVVSRMTVGDNFLNGAAFRICSGNTFPYTTLDAGAFTAVRTVVAVGVVLKPNSERLADGTTSIAAGKLCTPLAQTTA
mmetsp:Transcript_20241/g.51096  ORF Transcript_20241/g.51096 Transcript_20241/m.51096 type:complete len:211 (-) Transcript_20241:6114-6746(-)